MTMSSRAGMLYERRPPRRGPEPAIRAIISRDGERALRKELSRLRQELEVDFTARLRDARSFGESHGNDDYLQIKEEQAVIASRILQQERLLDSSEVVDGSAAAPGVITLGSLVRVRDVATEGLSEHRLAGGYEPLEANKISASPPVGQALFGRRAGDEVTVVPPGGRWRRLEVVAVRDQTF